MSDKPPAVLKQGEWICLADKRGISIPVRVTFIALLVKPEIEGGEIVKVPAVPWCAIQALDPCVRIWWKADDKAGVARLDKIRPFPFND